MIEKFIDTQCESWPLLRENRDILEKAPVKDLGDGFISRLLSYRKASATADLSKAMSGERPCFLCRKSRPAEQLVLPFGEYEILANPYPLHPKHLTIVHSTHTPQKIEGRIEDMIRLADYLPRHLVFYNGPLCGASAPDHLHFQAVGRELGARFECFTFRDGIITKSYPYILIDNPTPELFELVISSLPEADPEPMVNLLAMKMEEGIRLIIVPRKAHRPECYGDFIVSPASIETTGVFNLSREVDFERFDAAKAKEVMKDVCMDEEQFARLAF